MKVANGDMVLNYIGPGGYFGEIGLLSGFDELKGLTPEGKRTATCSALDHVDLVRIRRDDFLDLGRLSGSQDRTAEDGGRTAAFQRSSGRRLPLAGVRTVPRSRVVQRAESVGSRFGKMYALRRMRQGVCRARTPTACRV
ncbi:MAG: cyclic nucleotide-binding domain-containing protein [Pirellulales bacterium]